MFQLLEARRLMAVTFETVGRDLYVRGDDAANVIRFDGNYEGAGQVVISVTGQATRSFGLAAFDNIYVLAGGGNDRVEVSNDLSGGTFVLDVRGGAGNDTLSAGESVDAVLRGEAGNDALRGARHSDGGDGNDVIYGYTTISDGPGEADSLTGGAGNDTIYGLGGNDTIDAGSGDDVIVLERNSVDPEFVQVNVGTGNNRVETDVDGNYTFGSGNDTLFTSSGGDYDLGGGNDTLLTSVAGNYNLGDGDDVATLGVDVLGNFREIYGNINVFGGNGNDRIDAGAASRSSIAKLRLDGGGDNDWLRGSALSDVLYGRAGHDTLFGGDGNDILDGGTGNDSLSGEAGNDDLFGSDGNDTLTGGTGRDRFYGQKGTDRLAARDGERDTLFGSGGDVLDRDSIDVLSA